MSRQTRSQKTLPEEKGRHGFGGGLWLQVRDATHRSWLYRYKLNGRERSMGLGAVDKVGLEAARIAAEKWGALLVKGHDPIEARNAEHKEQAKKTASEKTFKAVAQEYMNAFKAGWRNAKHRTQWAATLGTYAYPFIGDMPVSEVSTEDVRKVLTPIWVKKTETASRVRQRIERVMGYAIALKWRTESNPARWRDNLENVLPEPKKIRKVVHYPSLPWREVPVFLAQLRSVTGTSARALELLILTASRSGPIFLARRKEFDLAARRWSCPGEHMKGGKPFEVPLSEPAVALLRNQCRDLSPEALVFPGARRNRPLSNASMTMLMRRMCDEKRTPPGVLFRDDQTSRVPVPHGFRSSFTDWAGDSTWYPREIVEAALAHVAGNAVTQSYRRSDPYTLRTRLMADWACYCEGRLTTEPPEDMWFDRPVGPGLGTQRDIEAVRLLGLPIGGDERDSRRIVAALENIVQRLKSREPRAER
jgi:integrase